MASWRNKNVCGITQFKSKDLRTRGVRVVSHRVQRLGNQELWCLRAKKINDVLKKTEQKFALPQMFLLYLGPQWIGWCPLTLKRMWLLYSVYYTFKCWSLPEIPSQTQPEIMFYWLSKHPFLVTQMAKKLPAMWDTWVQSLGQEDPLQKEIAIHPSILDPQIPRTETLMRNSPSGRKESDITEWLTLSPLKA